jgi:hypothetical protein
MHRIVLNTKVFCERGSVLLYHTGTWKEIVTSKKNLHGKEVYAFHLGGPAI